MNPLYENGLIWLTNGKASLEEFMDMYRSSQKYVDETLQFYYQLLKSDTTTLFIVGDHGINQEYSYRLLTDKSIDKEWRRWNTRFYHPACIICDSRVPRGENYHLVCNYSLAKLICMILKAQETIDFVDYDDEKIILQTLPIYGRWYLEQCEKLGGMIWTLGHVGVRTLEDCYIQSEIGEEHYYVGPNDQEIILENSKLEEYREMLHEELLCQREMLKLERFELHNQMIKEWKAGIF